MDLNRTPITYEQASSQLGVGYETIRRAVMRGVLTKLPRQGVHQRLMEGQVRLFKGKPLSLAELDQSDRELWHAYADSLKDPVLIGYSTMHELGRLIEDFYKRGGASQENPFSDGLETITR